jgi:magnesium-transporting ATPase (P-type)
MTFIVATTPAEEGSGTTEQTSTVGIIFELLPMNINLFVVLVVVAIPEGLPLTIQISLAFSVMRMFSRDKILLKKQDALEVIAEI